MLLFSTLVLQVSKVRSDGGFSFIVSFGGDGDSLLHPGVAVQQRQHEARHVSPPDGTAGGLVVAFGHKVSLVGQKLLSCRDGCDQKHPSKL